MNAQQIRVKCRDAAGVSVDVMTLFVSHKPELNISNKVIASLPTYCKKQVRL